jgi:hypothetical protein
VISFRRDKKKTTRWKNLWANPGKSWGSATTCQAGNSALRDSGRIRVSP